jgi:methylated-DNA-protein-cysteine methyltransferase-like protein
MKVRYGEIQRIVSLIPKGRVATYGQIAELARIPGQARRVGYALSALPEGSPIPWHRVVNARGEISLRSQEGAEALQRDLLQKEGIKFEKGKLSLERYQWKPKF